MAKKLFVLVSLLFALCSCDREYYVDNPEGTWQMTDAKVIARSPMGETIEATSMKELVQGALRIIKAYMPDEDYSDYEKQIDEMDDTPFSFTEDQTFRFKFLKDGNYISYTKNNGVWEPGDGGGEYSYAGSRLTFYSNNEDGSVTTIPCNVIRITNKKLILQMKVADMLSLPGGSPLDGGLSEENEESTLMVLSMLRLIDLTTELSFDKVKK